MTEDNNNSKPAVYTGITKHWDQEAGYAVWISNDWRKIDMVDGRRGWVFAPYPDHFDTCFTSEKITLKYKVKTTDADVLMEAINSCKVYRYIVKPWDPPDMLMTVERGLEAHKLARENEQFRKELIRRERLARELEIASEIQRYILPSNTPAVEGYEISGGVFSDTFGGRSFLPAPLSIELGKDVAFVGPEAEATISQAGILSSSPNRSKFM